MSNAQKIPHSTHVAKTNTGYGIGQGIAVFPSFPLLLFYLPTKTKFATQLALILFWPLATAILVEI